MRLIDVNIHPFDFKPITYFYSCLKSKGCVFRFLEIPPATPGELNSHSTLNLHPFWTRFQVRFRCISESISFLSYIIIIFTPPHRRLKIDDIILIQRERERDDTICMRPMGWDDGLDNKNSMSIWYSKSTVLSLSLSKSIGVTPPTPLGNPSSYDHKRHIRSERAHGMNMCWCSCSYTCQEW